MTPTRFDALCRAWHHKTRRPVPSMEVTFNESFFDAPPDDNDPNGQKTLAAIIPR